MKQSTTRKLSRPATRQLPVLPLRDVVVFPNMIFPVLVGRESSLRAAAAALGQDKYILLVAQRNSMVDEPEAEDIYSAGTVAKIIQMLRLPNGLMKILVEGESQAFITGLVPVDGYLEANVTMPVAPIPTDKKMQALMRQCTELFTEYINMHRGLPQEVLLAFENATDPLHKLYFVAANLTSKVETKQNILDITDIKEQYLELIKVLKDEIEVLKLEQEIDTKVQDTIQKSQRQFLIQEQI
jgi:ATP-dependent Lon protease